MSEHRPDCWVIIELTGSAIKDGPLRKVLGGWYGGYLGADEWRMSSGIEKIVDADTHWEIHNHSGSIYYCHKDAERLTGLTGSVLAGYIARAQSRPDGELTLRQVPIAEIPIV